MIKQIRKTPKRVFYSLLRLAGLRTESDYKQRLDDIARHKDTIAELTKAKHLVDMENQEVSKNIREIEESLLGESRHKLIEYSGKNIEASAMAITWCKYGKRGLLLRDVRINGELVAKHLWINNFKTNIKIKSNSRVYVYGTVEKYGSMSYSKELCEQYGIYNATVEKNKRRG